MKKLLLFLSLVLLACLLSSCSSNGQRPDEIGLVVILGKHANSYSFSNDNFQVVQSYLKRAFKQEQADGFNAVFDGTVIINDGMPEKKEILGANSKPLDKNIIANSPYYRKEAIKKRVEQGIMPFLKGSSCRATDEQADLLGALMEASLVLQNQARPSVEQWIIILDSGISTAGYLNMTKIDIQTTTNEDIVHSLQSAGAVPSLDGVRVIFLGLGNVAAPQEIPKNSIFQAKLSALWRDIIVAGGGIICNADGEPVDSIKFSDAGQDPMINVEGDSTSYPYVSVVSFADTSIEHTDIFSASMLGFLPDSAELRDPANTVKILRQAAVRLIQSVDLTPDIKIYIVGSEAKTALGQTSGRISEARATAVAQLLAIIGVPEQNLEVIGAGTTVFSWRNAVEYPSPGIYDEVAAQQNRVVAIFTSEDDNVSELQALGFLP